LLEERNQVKTPVSISFNNTEIKGDSISFSVNIKKLAPVKDGYYVLHLAITESNINYQWQNQDILNFVERKMLPDANGTHIDLINSQEIDIPFSFSPGDDWNIEELELVAFIQNLDDKEIINGHKEKLISVGTDKLISRKTAPKIYPNPSSGILNVSFQTQSAISKISLKILDLTGREIAEINKTIYNKGDHKLQWNLNNNLQNGTYILKLSVNNKAFTNKIIINK